MAQTVKAGGDTFTVPDQFSISYGGNTSLCRSCGAHIMWATHIVTGKRSPLNPDGTSHFATCPQADTWRR